MMAIASWRLQMQEERKATRMRHVAWAGSPHLYLFLGKQKIAGLSGMKSSKRLKRIACKNSLIR